MKIDKIRTLKHVAPFTVLAVGQHLLGATLLLSLSPFLPSPSLSVSHCQQFSQFPSASRAKLTTDGDFCSLIHVHYPAHGALKPAILLGLS
jgi:hypothetical protein